MGSISKKYKSPPLIEAVMEIHFECDNWTPKVVFDLYSLLKDDYVDITNRPPIRNVFIAPDGSTGVVENTFVQFWDSDKSNLIQISNNLLTVNCLPTYEGWAIFKKKIMFAFSCLNKVLVIKKINRLDFRTLNKIDIQTHSIENFKKYFTVYPNSPKNLFDNTSSIQLNIETKEDGGNAFLLSMNTTVKEAEYEAPVMFQLAFVKVSALNQSDIDVWLDKAHLKLGMVFESILTSTAKSTFN